MRRITVALVALSGLSMAPPAENTAYMAEIQKWREGREQRLRADNGWLTLAGRYPLKDGANTFGTGENNDVVFPAALQGVGPERLGTLQVNAKAKKVTLKPAEGVWMTSNGKPFSGERPMGTVTGKRDWVSLGRLSFYIIDHDGKYVLRLADNESLVRKNFPGCVWYPPNEAYKVEARFVPYSAGNTLAITNVIDEVSKEACPGYAEFQLNGETYRLDALKEDDGLFFVFRDGTAGDTTYGSARFLNTDKMPKANETFTLDFNKTYNPPCAFSAYTTCPLPPKQNILKTRIEAGEKYAAKH
jgi:uncharacterized protein (DUF1684 family)